MPRPTTATQITSKKLAHARRRAQERHGLNLSNADLAAMVEDIQFGRATILERQSNTRTIWLVNAPKHAKLCVVYDSKRKVICTVLPSNSREVQRNAHKIPGCGKEA